MIKLIHLRRLLMLSGSPYYPDQHHYGPQGYGAHGYEAMAGQKPHGTTDYDQSSTQYGTYQDLYGSPSAFTHPRVMGSTSMSGATQPSTYSTPGGETTIGTVCC
ncbi:uncharacterized protein LOC142767168 [Rhipicephalus microplus]|uniref:uncharacterized protein LOC142767168 n=1 Tax=Rhipicephalus microplus TaxID=6941 RepID=UPI003F6CB0F0